MVMLAPPIPAAVAKELASMLPALLVPVVVVEVLVSFGLTARPLRIHMLLVAPRLEAPLAPQAPPAVLVLPV